MPEATPAEAPHSALTGPSGRLATLIASLLRGELQLPFGAGVVISRGWTATADGAYRSGTVVGDGGSGSVADMWGTASVDVLEPFSLRGS